MSVTRQEITLPLPFTAAQSHLGRCAPPAPSPGSPRTPAVCVRPVLLPPQAQARGHRTEPCAEGMTNALTQVTPHFFQWFTPLRPAPPQPAERRQGWLFTPDGAWQGGKSGF